MKHTQLTSVVQIAFSVERGVRDSEEKGAEERDGNELHPDDSSERDKRESDKRMRTRKKVAPEPTAS